MGQENSKTDACDKRCDERGPQKRFNIFSNRKLKIERGRTSEISTVDSGRPCISTDTVGEGPIVRGRFIRENECLLSTMYEVDERKLGCGAYGVVTRGRHIETNQVRAIKIIHKSKQIRKLWNEISIMKSLDHPNIVKLHETFEDSRQIYLCMELCEGGELFDRIAAARHFTERDAAIFMKQILSGVHYLHSHNIIHRDLKPENLLLVNQTTCDLKLIDFGLSCRFEKDETFSAKAGTCFYIAPEVLAGRYNESCDYWSCGVILYIMLCGYPPFDGDDDKKVMDKVKRGEFTMTGKDWDRVSPSAKDLVSRLLEFNPEERITAKDALDHSWLTDNTFDAGVPAYVPENLMNNIRAFREQNKLKRAALTVIASQAREQDIKNLKSLFLCLDTDNSGTLSKQEMVDGFQRLGWENVPTDLQEIIRDMDSDDSGAVDYTEFIAAAIDSELYLKEDALWAAFRVFDLDGDDQISRYELLKFLQTQSYPDENHCCPKMLTRIMRECDIDGDGQIDFNEFCQMMQGVCLRNLQSTTACSKSPSAKPHSSSLLCLPRLTPFRHRNPQVVAGA